MTEQATESRRGTKGRSRSASAVPLPEVLASDAARSGTGIEELDRVLGGGLVPGMVVLVGGEPGIGKSTLLLQAADALARRDGAVLYVSGEESAPQLKLRGERLGIDSERILVAAETDVDAVVETVRELGPTAVVVDSIQAVRCSDLPSVPGTVGQVRESAARLVNLAKARGVPVLLVGHVTKDCSLAGPRALEHVVDTVLQFEGERHHAHRILRTLKNRFGASGELGVFTMTDSGLEGVANPSELFLSGRPTGTPGSVVLPAMEGTRPVLVEIQALVGEPAQGTPRRTTIGADPNRVALLLAVLQRRLGVDVGGRDVFVNVTGGLSVYEPAADLAIAAAVASSARRRPVPEDRTLLGEIGLTGEVRPVSRLDARLREAQRLGFTSAVVPLAAATAGDGIRRIGVRQVGEALEAGLG
jgi:DNA repair protein RadA/Sms